MYRLYEYPGSGNCYKVNLMLHLVGANFESVTIDIMQGESRTAEFLQINPNGRIPVLEIEPGNYLPESNAAMFYLAENTPYLPESRLSRARVIQWLCFEQYSHEPNIAVARFIIKFLGNPDDRRAQVARCQEQGRAALAVMDRHLADRSFFVDERMTIADIALYAYTHVSDEADIDLAPFPNVQRWLDRVAGHPGYVPMLRDSASGADGTGESA